MHLTDSHLVILSAAAARDDLLLPTDLKLRSGNVDTVIRRLIEAGYLEALMVTADDPVHGRDSCGGPTGLRITQAGLRAIGITDRPERLLSAVPVLLLQRLEATPPDRRGKRNRVIALLTSPRGLTVNDLMIETVWQRHTVRAFLSSLRRNGYTLQSLSDGPGRPHRYRIAPTGEEA